MELEILIEDDRWGDLPMDSIMRAAALATAEHLGLDADTLEVSVLACDDARITGLNTEFRHKPGPTNVLSWPAEDLSVQAAGALPRAPSPDFEGVTELGDIAIAYETCAREAAELGKPIADHVTHLLVHGLLHLLGYDHIRDPDAAVMQQIEREILGKMGLDDPYRG